MKDSTGKMALLTMILCGIAAVIWTVVAALHFAFGESSPWLVVLNVICALIWWIAFAVQAVRWWCVKGGQN